MVTGRCSCLRVQAPDVVNMSFVVAFYLRYSQGIKEIDEIGL